MNSRNTPNSEAVSFELVTHEWVDSGLLPVSLSRAGFGGSLSLLYEANRISEALGVPKVSVSASRRQTWLQLLAAKFEFSPDKKWPSYPSDVYGLEGLQAHSTLRLLSYPGLLSFRDEESIWSDTVIEETALFLNSILGRKTVLFATKFQVGKPKLGDFPQDQWLPILRELTNHYNVLVLGSSPTRKSFGDVGVVFLEDLLSLPAQVELVSNQSLPLIGDASGFFSPAIWHRGAYLCFKDPNYDEVEMRDEHAGGNQLLVGSGTQYLIRKQPTLNAVHDFLSEAYHGN